MGRAWGDAVSGHTRSARLQSSGSTVRMPPADLEDGSPARRRMERDAVITVASIEFICWRQDSEGVAHPGLRRAASPAEAAASWSPALWQGLPRNSRIHD